MEKTTIVVGRRDVGMRVETGESSQGGGSSLSESGGGRCEAAFSSWRIIPSQLPL